MKPTEKSRKLAEKGRKTNACGSVVDRMMGVSNQTSRWVIRVWPIMTTGLDQLKLI